MQATGRMTQVSHDLIDTTEMYLRTVLEMEEDGVVPMRARIVEALGHSGPTVSQTVARMHRDGLVDLTDDRRLRLTDEGRRIATAVLRKHRVVERLLVDVIGLELDHAHEEACRWEHVVSDRVEARIVALLGDPVVSPFGNPIPGRRTRRAPPPASTPARSRCPTSPTAPRARVVRLGEPAQSPHELLVALVEAGVVAGGEVEVDDRARRRPAGRAAAGRTRCASSSPPRVTSCSSRWAERGPRPAPRPVPLLRSRRDTDPYCSPHGSCAPREGPVENAKDSDESRRCSASGCARRLQHAATSRSGASSGTSPSAAARRLDQRGAAEPARQPFGLVIVWLVAVGLTLLSLWQLVEPSSTGRRRHEGRLKAAAGRRLRRGGRRGVRFALARAAAGEQRGTLTARLLGCPGPRVVGLVAVGILVWPLPRVQGR